MKVTHNVVVNIFHAIQNLTTVCWWWYFLPHFLSHFFNTVGPYKVSKLLTCEWRTSTNAPFLYVGTKEWISFSTWFVYTESTIIYQCRVFATPIRLKPFDWTFFETLHEKRIKIYNFSSYGIRCDMQCVTLDTFCSNGMNLK